MENVIENKKTNYLLILLKGVLVSLSISLILVLVFAFILRFVAISDSIIAPVNQVIRCISILFGTFFALKKNKEMGLITGLLIGVIFTVVAFFVFSLLDGSLVFSKTFLNDIVFGGIIGAISGIIAVSVKSK